MVLHRDEPAHPGRAHGHGSHHRLDLVRAQILVAQGIAARAGSGMPPQDKIPRNGYAVQCRITTEDPENKFTPDYGKILTYRSAADSAFGSMAAWATRRVITPFYDSLLVKVTASGADVRRRHCNAWTGPCASSAFAASRRTFRFSKTSSPTRPSARPGDDDVDRHHAGVVPLQAAPRSRDEAAELPRRRDRQRQSARERLQAQRNRGAADAVPLTTAKSSAAGTRHLLLEIGPKKFAEWTRKQKRLLITDTTFRDAHQSLLATRVRTYDMLAVADAVARPRAELFSMEMWGGATFDTAMRFLREDPWERLRQLARAHSEHLFPDALPRLERGRLFQLSGQRRRAIREARRRQGIDIFRIFDSLNYLPNLKVAMEAVQDTHAICEGAICYTGDILDPKRTKYSLKYYVKLAKELEKMGAHFLAIKDMAGLCRPYAAYQLVKALEGEIGLPIHFHTHDTSGIKAARFLKRATRAWTSSILRLPRCPARPASRISIPSSPPCKHRARHRGSICMRSTNSPITGKKSASITHPFDTAPKTGSAEVYLHEMPGGQYTNLKEQAAAWAWRIAGRNRAHLRRGEPAFRRHRESDAQQQSRRRHDDVFGHARHQAADVVNLEPGSRRFPNR
jgi:pyruvate carboxylase